MPQNKNRPVVVAVSQYPGGADAILPVLQLLSRDERVRLHVVASDWAVDILSNAGIKIDSIKGSSSATNFFENYFRQKSPGLLITDLVGNSPHDLLFASSRIARKKNVMILGVLDSWMNYPDRFKDPENNIHLGLLPDRLAVMNKFAFDELLKIGVPSDRISITGQPAFDKSSSMSKNGTEIRKSVMNSLGIPKDKKLIVFFSENTAEYYGSDPSLESYLGYTQHTSIDALIKALDEIDDSDLCLVIKRHPRENTPFPELYLHDKKVIQLSKTAFSPMELATTADINIGMASIMMVHSYLLGKKTLLLVPGMKKNKDLMVLTNAGVLNAISKHDHVTKIVKEAIESDNYMEKAILKKNWYLNDGYAAKRVAREIYKMLDSIGYSLKKK